MHKAAPEFWELYEQLPESAKKVADENLELLKANPRHPSLRFKKVGDFWSVRAGIRYRALAVKRGTDFIWVWIGTHSAYDHLVNA